MSNEDLLKNAWLAIVLGRAISFSMPLANGVPENILNFLGVSGFMAECVVQDGVISFRLSEADSDVIDLPIESSRHVAKNGWVFLTTTSRASLDTLVKREQRRIMREQKDRAKKDA